MVNNKEHSWARLDSVIKWSDMSINHFAHHIGIKRGENLYQIKRGHNGISRKLAETIVNAFPQINLIWLMSGEGEMLQEEDDGVELTAFYDMDAENNIRYIKQNDPTSHIMLPSRFSADFAMMHFGREMPFSIPSNTMVIFRDVAVGSVISGREYLVVTDNRSHLRRVIFDNDQGRNGGKIVLISDDRDLFADVEIETADITALFQVVAKLIINE